MRSLEWQSLLREAGATSRGPVKTSRARSPRAVNGRVASRAEGRPHMDYLASQALVDVLWVSWLNGESGPRQELNLDYRPAVRTDDARKAHTLTAHYVVSFHTLKEVNKHFWWAVVPPVLKGMFESWNWLKAKLLKSLPPPQEPWLLLSLRLAHDAWQMLTAVMPIKEDLLDELRRVVAIERPAKKGSGLPDRIYRSMVAKAFGGRQLHSIYYRYTQDFHSSGSGGSSRAARKAEHTSLTMGVTDGKDFVFWIELLRGWLHTQLSTDEQRKWPWILPNNIELSPPVLQILFAN